MDIRAIRVAVAEGDTERNGGGGVADAGKVLLVPVPELHRVGADGVGATMGLCHGTVESGREALAGDSRESAAEQLFFPVECLRPKGDRPGFYQGDVTMQGRKSQQCRPHALMVMGTKGNRGVSKVGGKCIGCRTIERETQREPDTHPGNVGLQGA